MCDTSCIIFGVTNLTPKEVQGKSVLEVGSCDVNGSLRPVIELWKPKKYVGVDISPGPGVDLICDADNLERTFGKESFDLVVSTEMLEHIKDWKKVISNIKNVCKSGGIILITTRSYGRKYHGYPFDFWRFELSDMKQIFADCIIEKIETDRVSPGIFIRVRKPNAFKEKDLRTYKLYSIITDSKLDFIEESCINKFMKEYQDKKKLEEKIAKLSRKLKDLIFRIMIK